jgi:hypothetical protein
MPKKSILLMCGYCFVLSSMAQTISKYIIVDQFGYLPVSQKIAVIKDPQVGFDAGETFVPGEDYQVINAVTGEPMFSGKPVAWNQGAIDGSSGDRAWHFDFSSVTETGRYYILDQEKNVRSFEFEISPVVYNEVLKHAVRTFFYQRVGFSKEAQFAGEAWADGASHIKTLQDKNCRLYSDKSNPATERDLSGGWYDAGDYNKYTNWTANYVMEMMKAYLENPRAWADDYNIPESGNGIPDLLDEAKWGIDFLLRMQQPDGGVLSIVAESGGSPPSNAYGQSVYGPATTSASLNSAAAFAISSKVYRAIDMTDYADTLLARALRAWDWAVLNPSVVFNNNSAENGSQGVGAGNQEEDTYGRSVSKLKAACFLFEVTGDSEYRVYFDNHYQQIHLIEWTFAYPYEPVAQDLLLYYTTINGASSAVADHIRNTYRTAMTTNSENFPAYYIVKDPYMAHMAEYTWGSNAQKSAQGSMYYNMIYYGLDLAKDSDSRNAALGYIHYLHGVNPLNFVYLSNMYAFGGDNCVNEFYHSWFCNGSAKWDRVGTSLYGPAPGFVTGGPNPYYDWDGCCPSGCGSVANNALCNAESITPPKGQPKQKSYKDFNTSWPLNSWSVTENSCGYQVNYIRLLSKFVDASMDCHGDSAGTASFDVCGVCSGGNTGRIPEEETCNCPVFKRSTTLDRYACNDYVSPSGRYTWTESGTYTDTIGSAAGCDSIVTVNLTIPEVNVSVTLEGETLMADASGATFRWLDCDDQYSVIADATGQQFTPLTTGTYGVEVSQYDCVDTSACYGVTITGIVYNTFGKDLVVYPNPATHIVHISMPEVFEKTTVELTGPSGRVLTKQDFINQKNIAITQTQPSGLYLLRIRSGTDKMAVVKLLVK